MKLVPAAATLPKVVVEALSGLQDKSSNSASCRWAVCVGEDGKLELQLQLDLIKMRARLPWHVQQSVC